MPLNADAKKAVGKGMLNGSARIHLLASLLNADSKRAKGKGYLNGNARLPIGGTNPPTPNNLYPNPLLEGGSNIVADVYTTLPTSHGAGAFTANPCDADYFGAGNPAYRFKSTGNSRFVLTVDINKASNQVTLPRGKRYVFVAQARQFSSNPLNQFRALGIAGLVGGARVVQDDTARVADAVWKAGSITFELPNDGLSAATLRHGMGVSAAVLEGWYEAKNLTLLEIGDIVYDPPLPDEPDLNNWLHNPATTYIYDGRDAHYRCVGTSGHVFEYPLTKDGSWDWAAGIDFEIIVRQTHGTVIPDFQVAPTNGAIIAGAETTAALTLNQDVVITGRLIWDADPTVPRIRIHGDTVGADNTHVWIRSVKFTPVIVPPNALRHKQELLKHAGEILTTGA